MLSGPKDEEISFEDTKDGAIKPPGATFIEAQTNREDTKPDLSSSNNYKHTGGNQRNHLAAMGCRVGHRDVRRKENNVLQARSGDKRVLIVV